MKDRKPIYYISFQEKKNVNHKWIYLKLKAILTKILLDMDYYTMTLYYFMFQHYIDNEKNKILQNKRSEKKNKTENEQKYNFTK